MCYIRFALFLSRSAIDAIECGFLNCDWRFYPSYLSKLFIDRKKYHVSETQYQWMSHSNQEPAMICSQYLPLKNDWMFLDETILYLSRNEIHLFKSKCIECWVRSLRIQLKCCQWLVLESTLTHHSNLGKQFDGLKWKHRR